MAFTHPKLDFISAPLGSFDFSAPFLGGVDGQQRMVVELGAALAARTAPGFCDSVDLQQRYLLPHSSRSSESLLVRAVAGTPINGLIGETIAGFDSLHFTARIDFEDLRDRLATYLKKSQEKTYQKEFGWIDHIREVRDVKLIEQLNRQLVKDLKSARTHQCWMGPDGIIDWNEVSYFQFGSAQSAPRFSNLTLDRFIEYLGGPKELTPDNLANARVRAIRADDSIAHEWPSERCLQAELQFSQRSYLLSSGKWYQVDEEFVASIDKIVREIKTCNIGLPEYEDTSEGRYNERAAALSIRGYLRAEGDGCIRRFPDTDLICMSGPMDILERWWQWQWGVLSCQVPQRAEKD